MKKLALTLALAAALWASPNPQGVVGNVAYTAASYNGGGMFPWYTFVSATSPDPNAVAFRVTLEFLDGHTERAIVANGNSVLMLGNWTDVARFTVEVLTVGQIYQAQ